MEKISKVGRRFECFVPDYSDLDKLYSMDIVCNDIDLAIRNKHLRGVIDTLLVDMSVPQPPQMSDADLIDNFIGKEYEPVEVSKIAHQRFDELVKESKKVSKENRSA